MLNISPDMCDTDGKPLKPWAVICPEGVYYLGLHSSEAQCWRVALGWPSSGEINHHKQAGWYACEVTIGRKAP